MITYKVLINGVEIQRIDARRLRSRNDAMDKNGYEYKVMVYDYQNETFKELSVKHKYKDGFGKLLDLITKKIN